MLTHEFDDSNLWAHGEFVCVCVSSRVDRQCHASYNVGPLIWHSTMPSVLKVVVLEVCYQGAY